MLGYFKNRIRTIIGTESGFLRSAQALITYASYQLLHGKLFTRLLHKFIHRPVRYEQWLHAEIISAGTSSNLICIVNEPPHNIIADGYVLFSNDGDNWRTDAISRLESCIRNNAFPDLVTFLFDERGANQKYIHPHFIPAWSPHKLAVFNYIQNAFCVKASLLDKHRLPLTSQMQYDFLLHLIKQPIRAHHLQEVLLHKKEVMAIEAKGELANLGNDLVSIIIPTRNGSDLVKQCIDSIINLSTYPDYEIILVDNDSNEKVLADLIHYYKNKLQSRFVHVCAQYPFNFSRLINCGAAQAKGNYLIFLNNDTAIISADWIESMLNKFTISKTGAVGAKLLYPDNTIQHAGIVLDNDCISRHIFLGAKAEDSAVLYDSNYLAVTAACMMVSKVAFNEVNGFDEHFAVNYNDIDFCLRLHKAGYQNVYAANVQLYHHESASRQHPFAKFSSGKTYRKESALMRSRWQQLISDDPYYSSLNNIDFIF